MKQRVHLAVSDPELRARLAALLRRDPDLILVGPSEPADLVLEENGASPLGGTAVEEDTELSPRELEVLRLMALGLGNKLIAHELGISAHTAKFHVAAVFSKLGVHSRTEAVALGMRRGLVPL